MTSTADPLGRSGYPSWWRTALLVVLLVLFGLQSPPPWAELWIVVPAGVAASLLAGWRFGAWGVLVGFIAGGLAAWWVGRQVFE